jgi:chlorobactene glucosyltransferase
MTLLEVISSPWLLTMPVCVPLAMTAANACTWPRGQRGHLPGLVSVCIPARDEEANIERCVRAVASSDHPIEEIIVLDDGSTDGTAEILAALAIEFPNLKVLQGRPLTEGWVGKVHACQQLADEARGDWLVFVDADTTLHVDGIGRLAGTINTTKSRACSSVPRQQMNSVGEQILIPLLHLTYTSWLFMPWVWLTSDPRFLAANGQLMALEATALREVGGFTSIRHEVVDDMALFRRLKSSGIRVAFADGHHMATTRMYTSGREVWDGFSKNMYEGIGGHPMALIVVIMMYTTPFVLPYLGLILSMFWPAFFWPSMVGVCANMALRLLLALRHEQPWHGVLLHPLGVIMMMALAINSWRWSFRGNITWRGRTYVAKADRGL